MSLQRLPVCEHRDMNGRFVQSRKLEPDVEPGTFRRLLTECLGITALEARAYGSAAIRLLYDNKSPWLAQSDRRRESCSIDQALNCFF